MGSGTGQTIRIQFDNHRTEDHDQGSDFNNQRQRATFRKRSGPRLTVVKPNPGLPRSAWKRHRLFRFRKTQPAFTGYGTNPQIPQYGLKSQFRSRNGSICRLHNFPAAKTWPEMRPARGAILKCPGVQQYDPQFLVTNRRKMPLGRIGSEVRW